MFPIPSTGVNVVSLCRARNADQNEGSLLLNDLKSVVREANRTIAVNSNLSGIGALLIARNKDSRNAHT